MNDGSNKSDNESNNTVGGGDDSKNATTTAGQPSNGGSSATGDTSGSNQSSNDGTRRVSKASTSDRKEDGHKNSVSNEKRRESPSHDEGGPNRQVLESNRISSHLVEVFPRLPTSVREPIRLGLYKSLLRQSEDRLSEGTYHIRRIPEYGSKTGVKALCEASVQAISTNAIATVQQKAIDELIQGKRKIHNPNTGLAAAEVWASALIALQQSAGGGKGTGLAGPISDLIIYTQDEEVGGGLRIHERGDGSIRFDGGSFQSTWLSEAAITQYWARTNYLGVSESYHLDMVNGPWECQFTNGARRKKFERYNQVEKDRITKSLECQFIMGLAHGGAAGVNVVEYMVEHFHDIKIEITSSQKGVENQFYVDGCKVIPSGKDYDRLVEHRNDLFEEISEDDRPEEVKKKDREFMKMREMAAQTNSRIQEIDDKVSFVQGVINDLIANPNRVKEVAGKCLRAYAELCGGIGIVEDAFLRVCCGMDTIVTLSQDDVQDSRDKFNKFKDEILVLGNFMTEAPSDRGVVLNWYKHNVTSSYLRYSSPSPLFNWGIMHKFVLKNSAPTFRPLHGDNIYKILVR